MENQSYLSLLDGGTSFLEELADGLDPLPPGPPSLGSGSGVTAPQTSIPYPGSADYLSYGLPSMTSSGGMLAAPTMTQSIQGTTHQGASGFPGNSGIGQQSLMMSSLPPTSHYYDSAMQQSSGSSTVPQQQQSGHGTASSISPYGNIHQQSASIPPPPYKMPGQSTDMGPTAPYSSYPHPQQPSSWPPHYGFSNPSNRAQPEYSPAMHPAAGPPGTVYEPGPQSTSGGPYMQPSPHPHMRYGGAPVSMGASPRMQIPSSTSGMTPNAPRPGTYQHAMCPPGHPSMGQVPSYMQQSPAANNPYAAANQGYGMSASSLPRDPSAAVPPSSYASPSPHYSQQPSPCSSTSAISQTGKPSPQITNAQQAQHQQQKSQQLPPTQPQTPKQSPSVQQPQQIPSQSLSASVSPQAPLNNSISSSNNIGPSNLRSQSSHAMVGPASGPSVTCNYYPNTGTQLPPSSNHPSQYGPGSSLPGHSYNPSVPQQQQQPQQQQVQSTSSQQSQQQQQQSQQSNIAHPMSTNSGLNHHPMSSMHHEQVDMLGVKICHLEDRLRHLYQSRAQSPGVQQEMLDLQEQIRSLRAQREQENLTKHRQRLQAEQQQMSVAATAVTLPPTTSAPGVVTASSSSTPKSTMYAGNQQASPHAPHMNQSVVPSQQFYSQTQSQSPHHHTPPSPRFSVTASPAAPVPSHSPYLQQAQQTPTQPKSSSNTVNQSRQNIQASPLPSPPQIHQKSSHMIQPPLPPMPQQQHQALTPSLPHHSLSQQQSPNQQSPQQTATASKLPHHQHQQMQGTLHHQPKNLPPLPAQQQKVIQQSPSSSSLQQDHQHHLHHHHLHHHQHSHQQQQHSPVPQTQAQQLLSHPQQHAQSSPHQPISHTHSHQSQQQLQPHSVPHHQHGHSQHQLTLQQQSQQHTQSSQPVSSRNNFSEGRSLNNKSASISAPQPPLRVLTAEERQEHLQQTLDAVVPPQQISPSPMASSSPFVTVVASPTESQTVSVTQASSTVPVSTECISSVDETCHSKNQAEYQAHKDLKSITPQLPACSSSSEIAPASSSTPVSSTSDLESRPPLLTKEISHVPPTLIAEGNAGEIDCIDRLSSVDQCQNRSVVESECSEGVSLPSTQDQTLGSNISGGNNERLLFEDSVDDLAPPELTAMHSVGDAEDECCASSPPALAANAVSGDSGGRDDLTTPPMLEASESPMPPTMSPRIDSSIPSLRQPPIIDSHSSENHSFPDTTIADDISISKDNTDYSKQNLATGRECDFDYRDKEINEIDTTNTNNSTMTETSPIAFRPHLEPENGPFVSHEDQHSPSKISPPILEEVQPVTEMSKWLKDSETQPAASLEKSISEEVNDAKVASSDAKLSIVKNIGDGRLLDSKETSMETKADHLVDLIIENDAIDDKTSVTSVDEMKQSDSNLVCPSSETISSDKQSKDDKLNETIASVLSKPFPYTSPGSTCNDYSEMKCDLNSQSLSSTSKPSMKETFDSMHEKQFINDESRSASRKSEESEIVQHQTLSQSQIPMSEISTREVNYSQAMTTSLYASTTLPAHDLQKIPSESLPEHMSGGYQQMQSQKHHQIMKDQGMLPFQSQANYFHPITSQQQSMQLGSESSRTLQQEPCLSMYSSAYQQVDHTISPKPTGSIMSHPQHRMTSQQQPPQYMPTSQGPSLMHPQPPMISPPMAGQQVPMDEQAAGAEKGKKKAPRKPRVRRPKAPKGAKGVAPGQDEMAQSQVMPPPQMSQVGMNPIQAQQPPQMSQQVPQQSPNSSMGQSVRQPMLSFMPYAPNPTASTSVPPGPPGAYGPPNTTGPSYPSMYPPQGPPQGSGYPPGIPHHQSPRATMMNPGQVPTGPTYMGGGAVPPYPPHAPPYQTLASGPTHGPQPVSVGSMPNMGYHHPPSAMCPPPTHHPLSGYPTMMTKDPSMLQPQSIGPPSATSVMPGHVGGPLDGSVMNDQQCQQQQLSPGAPAASPPKKKRTYKRRKKTDGEGGAGEPGNLEQLNDSASKSGASAVEGQICGDGSGADVKMSPKKRKPRKKKPPEEPTQSTEADPAGQSNSQSSHSLIAAQLTALPGQPVDVEGSSLPSSTTFTACNTEAPLLGAESCPAVMKQNSFDVSDPSCLSDKVIDSNIVSSTAVESGSTDPSKEENNDSKPSVTGEATEKEKKKRPSRAGIGSKRKRPLPNIIRKKKRTKNASGMPGSDSDGDVTGPSSSTSVVAVGGEDSESAIAKRRSIRNSGTPRKKYNDDLDFGLSEDEELLLDAGMSVKKPSSKSNKSGNKPAGAALPIGEPGNDSIIVNCDDTAEVKSVDVDNEIVESKSENFESNTTEVVKDKPESSEIPHVSNSSVPDTEGALVMEEDTRESVRVVEKILGMRIARRPVNRKKAVLLDAPEANKHEELTKEDGSMEHVDESKLQGSKSHPVNESKEKVESTVDMVINEILNSSFVADERRESPRHGDAPEDEVTSNVAAQASATNEDNSTPKDTGIKRSNETGDIKEELTCNSELAKESSEETVEMTKSEEDETLLDKVDVKAISNVESETAKSTPKELSLDEAEKQTVENKVENLLCNGPPTNDHLDIKAEDSINIKDELDNKEPDSICESKEANLDVPDVTKEEETEEVEEFYIKYKGFSYIHCEWRAIDEIEDPRIIGKIKRYKNKRLAMGLLPSTQSSVGNGEDIEEDDEDLFNMDYIEVDRVLDMRVVCAVTGREVKPRSEVLAARRRQQGKGGNNGENSSFTGPKRSKQRKRRTIPRRPVQMGGGSEEESPVEESEDSSEEGEDDVEDTGPLSQEEVKPENQVTYYLVKWRSLSYEDSTWELAQDVDPLKVKEYMSLRLPPPVAQRRRVVRPEASKWEKIEQNGREYKNDNQLREYQLEGVNWLSFCWYNERNCILADEMGLGKTVQSIAFLLEVFRGGVRGPYLIIVPLSTLGNWQREFENWTELNVIVYHGSTISRQMLQQYEMFYNDVGGSRSTGSRIKECFKCNAVITTYEILMTDIEFFGQFEWRVSIIDEAHRLKNKKCKLGEGLRYLNLEHRVLLTGTPLQNNVEELFSLLNFLEPEQFHSSEQFLADFGDLKSEDQVEKLQAILKPMMLRRLKEDVETSIAPKEETIIEVELTNIQKKYYRAILERNFAFLSKGASSNNVPNLMNTMMELRKCCNHPFLIKGAEDNIIEEMRQSQSKEEKKEDNTSAYGDQEKLQFHALVYASGKLVLVHKLLPKLRAGGHKVLVFSQMIRVLDIIEDYLIYLGYPYERIDGRIHGLLRQEAIDRFSTDADKFVFLLCTKAGGLGINLTAADTVIIYDSDWNPQNDLQAQARCHRIGQQKEVKVYRLITRDTYEREMFDRASMKLGLDKAILQSMGSKEAPTKQAAMTKKEIEELLKKGAYGALMSDDKEGEEFCEEDIDQILQRRAKVVQLQSQGEKNSTFAKASFSMSDNRSDIDLDDPNFWQKWAKKAGIDDNIDDNKELIMDVPRQRRQTNRYAAADAAYDLSDLDSPCSEASSDGTLVSRTSTRASRRAGRHAKKNQIAAAASAAAAANQRNKESGSGRLERSDLFRVEKGLLTWGWGRWDEILAHANFKRQRPRPLEAVDLEHFARAILIYALSHYNGDSRIGAFIWDLVRPDGSGNGGNGSGDGGSVSSSRRGSISGANSTPNTPSTTPAPGDFGNSGGLTRDFGLFEMKRHSGLVAPVARGRRTGNRRYIREATPDSMSLGNGSLNPGLPLSSGTVAVEEFDAEAVLGCDAYKKHLQRSANKLLHRVRTLYFLQHEIIGDARSRAIVTDTEFREWDLDSNLSSPPSWSGLDSNVGGGGDLPVPWWDSEADKCLLAGIFKHGFEKYLAIRADPCLCFLSRCGPPDGQAVLAEEGTELDEGEIEKEEIEEQPEQPPTLLKQEQDEEAEEEESKKTIDEASPPPLLKAEQCDEDRDGGENAHSVIGQLLEERDEKTPSTDVKEEEKDDVSPKDESTKEVENEEKGSSDSPAAPAPLPETEPAVDAAPSTSTRASTPTPLSATGAVGAASSTSSATTVGTATPSRSNFREKLPFPSTPQLNARFRKLVTHFQRQRHQTADSENILSRGRFRIGADSPQVDVPWNTDIKQLKWSRREEADFYRVVSSFGVERVRGDEEPTGGRLVWDNFRLLANLSRKSDEALEAYFEAFQRMCRRVCHRQNPGVDVPPSPASPSGGISIKVEPISEERAARCLARIDLLDRIRNEVLTHSDLDERLSLCQPSPDLPEWWLPGKHDKDLLVGAARHGVSRTDYNILTDPELSFLSIAEAITQRVREETPMMAGGKTMRDTPSRASVTSDDSQQPPGQSNLEAPGSTASPVVTGGGDFALRFATNLAVGWPKDRTILHRLESICHCVKQNEWPNPARRYFFPPTSSVPGPQPQQVVLPVTPVCPHGNVVASASSVTTSTSGAAITSTPGRPSSSRASTPAIAGQQREIHSCATAASESELMMEQLMAALKQQQQQHASAVASGSHTGSISTSRHGSGVGRGGGRGRKRAASSAISAPPSSNASAIANALYGSAAVGGGAAATQSDLASASALAAAYQRMFQLNAAAAMSSMASGMTNEEDQAQAVTESGNAVGGAKRRKVTSSATPSATAEDEEVRASDTATTSSSAVTAANSIAPASTVATAGSNESKKKKEDKTGSSNIPSGPSEVWDIRVPLLHMKDGTLIYGDQAPRRRDLEQWLDEHPDYMPYSVEREDQEIFSRVAQARGQDTSIMDALAYSHYMSMLANFSSSQYGLVPNLYATHPMYSNLMAAMGYGGATPNATAGGTTATNTSPATASANSSAYASQMAAAFGLSSAVDAVTSAESSSSVGRGIMSTATGATSSKKEKEPQSASAKPTNYSSPNKKESSRKEDSISTSSVNRSKSTSSATVSATLQQQQQHQRAAAAAAGLSMEELSSLSVLQQQQQQQALAVQQQASMEALMAAYQAYVYNPLLYSQLLAVQGAGGNVAATAAAGSAGVNTATASAGSTQQQQAAAAVAYSNYLAAMASSSTAALFNGTASGLSDPVSAAVVSPSSGVGPVKEKPSSSSKYLSASAASGKEEAASTSSRSRHQQPQDILLNLSTSGGSARKRTAGHSGEDADASTTRRSRLQHMATPEERISAGSATQNVDSGDMVLDLSTKVNKK